MDRNITRLLGGADAGHFTLPETWAAIRRAVSVVGSRRADARQRASMLSTAPAAAYRAVTAELIDAALTGKDLPADFLAPVERARTELARAADELGILTAASEALERRLSALISDESDDFIELHLAPALTEVLATAANAAPLLAGLDVTSASAVLGAPKPVQAAYQDTEQAAARYAALRAAQHALWQLAGRPFGAASEWSAGLGRRLPENPIAALLAIADRGTAWIPTREEERAAAKAATVQAVDAPRRTKRGQISLGTV